MLRSSNIALLQRAFLLAVVDERSATGTAPLRRSFTKFIRTIHYVSNDRGSVLLAYDIAPPRPGQSLSNHLSIHQRRLNKRSAGRRVGDEGDSNGTEPHWTSLRQKAAEKEREKDEGPRTEWRRRVGWRFLGR